MIFIDQRVEIHSEYIVLIPYDEHIMSHTIASAKHLLRQSHEQPSRVSPSGPPAPIDWLHGKKSGLVSLPDHSLFLRASGPDREGAKVPAVVIEHGLWGTSMEWLAVERFLSRFARVYSYERAGYYRSDPKQTTAPTARNIAADLRRLLQAAHVTPPFVLVGHSYGGVLVRQFLADYREEVAAMVKVDSTLEVTKVGVRCLEMPHIGRSSTWLPTTPSRTTSMLLSRKKL